MLLHFFVQGRPPGASEPAESESYTARAVHWTTDTTARLSEMSLDEMVGGVRARGTSALESAKRMFRFLSGDAVPRTAQAQAPPQREMVEKKEGGWMVGFTGLFSGLRGPTATSASGGGADSSDGSIHTDGEVHADLVMVCHFLDHTHCAMRAKFSHCYRMTRGTSSSGICWSTYPVRISPCCGI